MRALGKLSLAVVLTALVLPALLAGGRSGDAGEDDRPTAPDDGRAGTVRTVQGTVLVRPAGSLRFTPLGRGDLVAVGDLVRTATPGAHLAELDLVGARVVLGPGTTVRLKARDGLFVDQGDLEVVPAPGATVAVEGPGGFAQSVTGAAPDAAGLSPRLQARCDGRTVTVLDKEPRWLTSWRAAAGAAWAGGLTAKIDGRDVDLAVVRHEVTVEVRDQLARTTIEQVFRNATDVRTEGTFRFPLPAGASISGFAMWIGDEMVEADIVERQRARQIYEDILRRKKDPGLLEWEGGNLFQARVFPIEARSTKRVRVRYTQVLPLQGQAYRYRVPLTSELLRQKPLEHLSVKVRLQSDTPIASVSSPTHPVNARTTEHTADVEYMLEGASPDRDFELEVALTSPPDLVLLPHRRGDDGYFLVQLRPPTPEAQGFERTLVPEGKPLDVVLVADTSGSMSASAREAQDAFLRAFVALLGAEDRVRLMAYDVKPVWLLGEETAPDGAAVTGALDALAARRSLGWSDVDAGLAAALEAAHDGGLVIHVGDGIVTTGDADPQALATRLAALGKRFPGRAVHAVAPSSTYEAPVLEAMARLGGGSLRTTDPAAPADTAAALLRDALLPQWKNLKLRIEGVPTARVYPEVLPNTPAGTQLMVLGRFAPTDHDTPITVHIEGDGPDGPVRVATKAVLPGTDGGNDFLPRLWARRHLDALLAQGADAETQAEIVEFSERFGILTPYTSLLVLESDEDRERYGVGRRVHMRDGERFFAEARDTAVLEARRTALREASGWRTWLRAAAMREIAGLGHDYGVPYPPSDVSPVLREANRDSALGELVDATHGMRDELQSGKLLAFKGEGGDWGGEVFEDEVSETLGLGGGAGGRFAGRGGRGGGGAFRAPPAASPMPTTAATRGYDASNDDTGLVGAPESELRQQLDEVRSQLGAAQPQGGGGFIDDMDFEEDNDDYAPADRRASLELARKRPARRREDPRLAQSRSLWASLRTSPWWDGFAWRERPGPGPSASSLGFPYVPPDLPVADPEAPESPWPADLRERLESILRRGRFVPAEGAWHVTVLERTLHPLRGTPTNARRSESWVAADGWYQALRQATTGSEAAQWWLLAQRGAVDVITRLARTRAGAAGDASDWGLPLTDLENARLLSAFERSHEVRIAGEADGRVTFRFTPRGERPGVWREWVVDTKRQVLVEERAGDERTGRVTWRRVHEDLVDVGGLTLPSRTVSYDKDGRAIADQAFAWESLDAAAWTAKAAQLAQPGEDVLVLSSELPSLVDARLAVAGGSATLADHLSMLVDAAARADAGAVAKHLDGARAADPAHPKALDAIALTVLPRVRRPDDMAALRPRLLADARGSSPSRAIARALRAVRGLGSQLGANELLALLESVAPILTADADVLVDEEIAWRDLVYDRARLQGLARAERRREATAFLAELAARWPHELDFQLAQARALRSAGDRAASRAWLADSLVRGAPWLDHEVDALYTALTDALWQDRLLDELVASTTAWTTARPDSAEAWKRAATIAYLTGRDAETDAEQLSLLAAPPASRDDDVLAARQQTAVWLLLGDGWLFNVQGILPQHAEALGRFAAAAFAQDGSPTPRMWSLAQRIATHWRFRRTEGNRHLEEALRQQLLDGAASATTERLQVLLGRVVLQGDARNEDRERIVETLRTRQAQAQALDERDALAGMILSLLDQSGQADAALAFQRERLARRRAAEEPTEAIVRDLVERLLRTEDGDEARENEVVALLATFAATQQDERAAAADAARWAHRLAERFEAWRQRTALGSLEDLAKLSREAQAEARRAARDEARSQLVTRLPALASALPPAFGTWLDLEALAVSVQSGTDIEARTAAALERLGGDWARDRRPAERVQRERLATALAFATLRRTPPEGLAERLLAVLDGIAKADTFAREVETDQGVLEVLLDGRYHVARLLVALDRGEEVRARLASWIGTEGTSSRWTVLLAHLEAEAGDLAAAVKRLEPLQEQGSLAADVLARLATWRLALGDDAAREKARQDELQAMQPWALRNQIRNHARNLSRRGEAAGGELEPEALQLVEALLARVPDPASYAGDLRSLYAPTKDHRVVAMLVPGLVGFTTERAYSSLSALSTLLGGVHEEATLDAVREALASLRAKAQSAVDRRVLDLAETRVAARAAEVLMADPAHARAAVAALARALEAPPVEGERMLLARYLVGVGPQRDASLAQLTVRGIRDLMDGLPAAAEDRLVIGTMLAGLLGRMERHDDQEDLLAALWGEVRASSPTELDGAASNVLRALVDARLERGHAERAERALLTELAERPEAPGVDSWREKLFDVRLAALQRGLRTTLGEGAALYGVLRDALRSRLDEEAERASEIASRLAQVHQTATVHPSLKGMSRADLQSWSEASLPAILRRLPQQATGVASTFAGTLAQLGAPAAGLSVLLDRAEAEPRFLQRVEWDVASRQLDAMAVWRRDAGTSARPLEARLWVLVEAALESALMTGERGGQRFWNAHDRYAWNERFDDMQALIERVVEQESGSSSVAWRGAQILHDRMQRGGAGIDVLESAVARMPDQDNLRRRLAEWLLQAGRASRARPHAQLLVDQRPDHWNDRDLLARVLIGVHDQDALRTLLEDTANRWREKKQFVSGTARHLAERATEGGLLDRAIAWLDEAVRLRREERGDVGGQDHWLADTYTLLSRARSKAGDDAGAFEAARAALVMTSARDARRVGEARLQLERVLQEARELEALDAAYEAEVAETGLDAGLLRQAFASAWRKRGGLERAEHHLLEARDLEPNDAKVHATLVSLYDEMKRPADAVAALYGSIELAPLGYDAYEDLARRLATLGNQAGYERALTSLAEPAPNQAEGHRRLGRAFTRDGRLEAALVQWAQVVRTERLDPTGWLEYAESAVRAGDTATARKALQHVLEGTWEDRFGDVKQQAAARLARLPS
ncbi:MAG: VIT domain-containing protein [Planctomycetota bacterium]